MRAVVAAVSLSGTHTLSKPNRDAIRLIAGSGSRTTRTRGQR
jgi:hypothetical protein